jgi:hypothetical protein
LFNALAHQVAGRKFEATEGARQLLSQLAQQSKQDVEVQHAARKAAAAEEAHATAAASWRADADVAKALETACSLKEREDGLLPRVLDKHRRWADAVIDTTRCGPLYR